MSSWIRVRASASQPELGDFARASAIVAVIAAGLLLDQHVEFWGQTATSFGVWALFLHWLRDAEPRHQLALAACVVYATLGEIFLSLVWGLYEYRLANIPLFVPPGHALLFMLGSTLAARVGNWINWIVPLAAAPFIGLLLLSKAGTLDAALFVLFILCILFGSARRLYAVMFVLSLAMEIYGTALGNWAWETQVPWLGLTTINPPLAAGAFYCVLDLLVVATVARTVDEGRAGAVPVGAGAHRGICQLAFGASAVSRNNRSAATTRTA